MSASAEKEGKVKWPRAVALQAARELLALLTPLCARIIVAGSLRRRKAEVGDVELVYVPRWVDWPNPATLFHEPVPTNVMDHALGLLLGEGTIARRLTVKGTENWGARNKYAVHVASGVPVDFFATTAECWWNNLVCRTGGERNNTEIASAALERGWEWNPTGVGFTRASGPDKGRVQAVHAEEEVFAFVGMEYLQPEERR